MKERTMHFKPRPKQKEINIRAQLIVAEYDVRQSVTEAKLALENADAAATRLRDLVNRIISQ